MKVLIELTTIKGSHGESIYLDNVRIAGSKPGINSVEHAILVDAKEIQEIINFAIKDNINAVDIVKGDTDAS